MAGQSTGWKTDSDGRTATEREALEDEKQDRQERDSTPNEYSQPDSDD